MKNHYLRLIEKELDRLYVGSQNILVLKLGKDKFHLTDGKSSLYAKGHQIYALTKKLHDKAGVNKFWRAMGPLNPNLAPYQATAYQGSKPYQESKPYQGSKPYKKFEPRQEAVVAGGR